LIETELNIKSLLREAEHERQLRLEKEKQLQQLEQELLLNKNKRELNINDQAFMASSKRKFDNMNGHYASKCRMPKKEKLDNDKNEEINYSSHFTLQIWK
jgi:hypothetical protein